jgi:hypothetical protein
MAGGQVELDFDGNSWCITDRELKEMRRALEELG